MKIECPVCGRTGIQEIRGNSQRILHYKGFIDGKRVYEKHSIVGINGNKSMGIKTAVLGLKDKLEPSAGFGPATITLPR